MTPAALNRGWRSASSKRGVMRDAVLTTVHRNTL
jgi:hypothetical protein